MRTNGKKSCGMSRETNMATMKKTVRAGLAGLVLMVLALGGLAQALDKPNITIKDNGSRTSPRKKCPDGKTPIPDTGPKDCPCDCKNASSCPAKTTPVPATGDAPDVVPSLGEPVDIQMIAGDVPRSTSWNGVPNFGTYRFMSCMTQVYLLSGTGTVADSQHTRPYAYVIFPGYAKVTSFKQSSSTWSTYLPVKDENNNVLSELVPAGSSLAFSGGTYGLDTCVLSYPDGQQWTYEFYDFDKSLGYDGSYSQDILPRKYRLTKRVDRHGYETILTYSASALTITDPSGNAYVCTLGDNQRIAKIAVAGRTWRYVYTGNTVSTEINDQTGESTAITLTNDLTHLASVVKTGSDGKQTSEVYTYDGNGNLTNYTVNGVNATISDTDAIENLDGSLVGRTQGTTWTVNTKTRVMTRGGLTNTYKYGPNSQYQETDGRGKVLKTPRSRLEQGTATTDRNNNTTTTASNDDGYLTSESFPNGTQSSYTYDSNSNMLTKTTPDGVWNYTYDSHNLVTREHFVANSQTLSDVSYERYPWLDNQNQPHQWRGLVKYKTENVTSAPLTRKTYFEYNAKGQVALRKGPYYSNESEPTTGWVYTYDSWGNRLTETNPLNQTTTYTYDGGNRLATVTDALSHTTIYTYDGIGRKTRVTDATGAYTQWTYDTRGYVTQISGSAAMGGGCTSCGQAAGAGDKLGTYVYADSGLLSSYTDLNSHTWTYAYDLAGRKTSETDPTNYTTSYTYDDEGNLLTVTDPNNHTTTYVYDNMNRLSSITNAENETVSYTYDSMGRQLTVSGPVSGAVVTTTYDKLGRVATVTDQRSKVTSYTYDMAGRQLVVTAAVGTADEVQTSFAYDAHDNLLTTVEDSAQGGLARTTTNTYDAADRLTQTAVDPNGLNLVTSFGYDAAGRLTSSTVDPGSSPHLAIATTYTYDAVGRQLSTTTGYLVTSTTYNAAGWVISASNGITTTDYEYDEVGNRTKMTVSGRSPVFYSYDHANRLTGTSQAAGNDTITTSRTPDGVNLTLTSTDPNNNTTTFTYDGANRVLTATNAASETTSYTYDAAGRVITVTAPDTGAQQTAYDLAGNVTSTTDPLNRVTGFAYDNLNRVVTVTQPDSVVNANTYDKLGRVTQVAQDTAGLNRVTARAYDAAGRLTTVTVDPGTGHLGLETRYEYDAASRRIRTVVPANRTGDPADYLVTVYTYDALGLVLTSHSGSVADPYANPPANNPATLPVTNTYYVDGQLHTTNNGVTTTTLVYDTAGARSSLTVSGRAPINYTYDSAGRLTATSQTVSGVTIATTYTLDLGGRVTASSDGESKTTTFAYDMANRVTAETNPAGETTTYGYDPNGRQTLAAMASGSRSVTQYDKAGQVTKTLGGPSGQATYTYDSMGRLTVVTDANSRTRTTGYDGLGRKTSTANEMSQTVGFGYDLAGRWTTLTDPNSNVTTWAYDKASRQLTMTYPAVTGQSANVEGYAYGANGLLSQKTTPNAVNIPYTYDAAGNLASVNGVSYTRDSAGAVTAIADGTVTMGFTYDQFGRVTGVSDTGGTGKSLTYAYDKRSLRTSMGGDLPEGLAYAYDNAGRLVTVTKGNDGASTYAYDAGGRRKSLTLTNSVVTAYKFDGQDRLLSLATTGTSSTVASFGYTVDAIGNRKIVKEKDYTLYYRYDTAYRVNGESRLRKADGLHVYEDAFTYDAAGNRLTRVKKDFGGTEPATATPYGLWPLDEVNAKSFTPPSAIFTTDSDTQALYHLEDSDQPIADASGNGHVGTLVNTVELQVAGEFDNGVRIPLPSDLTPPAVPGYIQASAVSLGSGDWTLEAWGRPEAANGERTVIAQTDTAHQPVVILSLSEGFPALLVRYSVSGNVGEIRLVGKTASTLNTWQHLAAVRNGTRLALFLDGQCVALDNLPSNASVLSVDKLLIGCGDPNGTGVRAAGNFAGKLDEVRVSSIARYTGLTTPEMTGNGPAGELIGGVALTDDGRFGPALAFDGSGYVKLTDDGNFLKQGASKRTIELWVKATSTSGSQMLYEDGGSTSGFALRINAGTLEFRALDSGTGKTISAAYTSTDWHKVTAVYNEGAMTLYVDGTSVASDTASFSSVSAQADGAALGGTVGTDAFGGSTTGGSFTGSIDAVRVINDAVTPAAMTTTETTYTYNARNQLTLESITGGNYKKYYYNNNGENTSIEEYDSGDNLLKTTTMTYDDFGRMLTWSDGTNTETHTYRGAGWERASTTTGGTTTTYLYDGDNVVGDLVSGAFTRQYVTPFLDENLSMTIQGETPATYYYSRDGLGSVRTLTDANSFITNRYSMTAFGENYIPGTNEGVPQRYQFAGREASANATAGAPMFYRNRMYSPGLGRFGRRDSLLGGDSLYNAYGFPVNNPITNVDPYGLYISIQCNVNKYLEDNHVANFDRTSPNPDQEKGPFTYKRKNGGDVGFTKGDVVSEILAKMISSKVRNFAILGDTPADCLKNLKLHVMARKNIVDSATSAKFGPATLTEKYAESHWKLEDIVVFGVVQRKAWAARKEKGVAAAVEHLWSAESQTYQLGCHSATSMVCQRGVLQAMVEANKDTGAEEFSKKSGTRIPQEGNNWSPFLKEYPNVEGQDWVPGDWGYVTNLKPTTNKLLDGENIIYVGNNKWWGYGDSVSQRMLSRDPEEQQDQRDTTLPATWSWFEFVKEWGTKRDQQGKIKPGEDGGARIESLRRSPKIGLNHVGS